MLKGPSLVSRGKKGRGIDNRRTDPLMGEVGGNYYPQKKGTVNITRGPDSKKDRTPNSLTGAEELC